MKTIGVIKEEVRDPTVSIDALRAQLCILNCVVLSYEFAVSCPRNLLNIATFAKYAYQMSIHLNIRQRSFFFKYHSNLFRCIAGWLIMRSLVCTFWSTDDWQISMLCGPAAVKLSTLFINVAFSVHFCACAFWRVKVFFGSRTRTPISFRGKRHERK